MSTDADLQWLIQTSKTDEDIKLMVNAVCAPLGLNPISLRDEIPELYEVLLWECFSVVEQTGDGERE